MPERSSGARLKMKNYEIMFIVNPNTPDEEVDKINSQVEGVITSGGGQVQKTEKMGTRKLAYEIDRHREGHYVLFVVTANGDIVREVERRLRVMDPVIKYITVRTDEDTRRLEKIKSFRQRRATRRSSQQRSAAVAELPEEPGEEEEM
jgi:small subunit ribosomal protein S6